MSLPSDGPIRFNSDNTATACPEIMAAIAEANEGLVLAYGDDRWTKRLDAVFGDFFGAEVRAFAVMTGTAANALSLATIARPYGTIFAHEEAHVVREECGASEFYTGGARVVPVPGTDGKLTIESVGQAIDASSPTMAPSAISLTQVTDLGTVYQPTEIAALSELAHRRDMRVHLDGARFANAVVSLGCHPGDITWRAGVDVLSFGATKNGALGAEAVVFFDRALVGDFEMRRRRGGHLVSKSRYVAAQLLAFLESGVWRRNAERANRLAQRLVAGLAVTPLYPVDANELFLALGENGKRRVREAGFEFDDWGPCGSGEARFVVSWDQRDQDVEALGAALGRLG